MIIFSFLPLANMITPAFILSLILGYFIVLITISYYTSREDSNIEFFTANMGVELKKVTGTDANGTVSGEDVSITINSGDTLSFNVDAASHPFYIKTAQGTGTDNQASGVSNNGATNGTVTWTPTTAGTYYYQCSAHNGMYGTITVQ